MQQWDPIEAWRVRSLRTFASWRSLSIWADALKPLAVVLFIGLQAVMFTGSTGQGRALQLSLAATVAAFALLVWAYVAIGLGRARALSAAAKSKLEVVGIGHALDRLGSGLGNERELTVKLHWRGAADARVGELMSAVAHDNRCAAEVLASSPSTTEWKVWCDSRFGAHRRLARFLTQLWPQLARSQSFPAVRGVCVDACEEFECAERRGAVTQSTSKIAVQAKAKLLDWVRVLGAPTGFLVVASLICMEQPRFTVWLLPTALLIALLAALSIARFTIRRRLFPTRFVFEGDVAVVQGARGSLLAREQVGHGDFELWSSPDQKECWLCWQGGRALVPLKHSSYRALSRMGMRECASDPVGRHAATAWEKLLWTVVYLGSVIWVASALVRRSDEPSPEEIEPAWPSLKGRFEASQGPLGTWELEPMACLAGRERGFHGILFQFRDGSPIRELWLDTERVGDNVVEVHFFDVERDAIRVRERDCRKITGRNEISNLEINGRPLQELKGWLHIECPSLGLRAWVKYNGCLPQN